MNHLYQRIEEAHRALRPQVAITPLSHSPLLSKLTGCEVYLKCEHLQHTGSFKFRGASNKLRVLDTQASRNGVITASNGNHGQGIALAGKLAGVPVTVYAAASASPVKLDAIRGFGAEVILIDGAPLDAELEAAREAKRQKKIFVSPYNDLDVIAGQGTIGVELHEQADAVTDKDIAAAFVAVGGGGLIAGIGAALRELRPATAVVGCWAANATAMYSSLEAGAIVEVDESDTISDGTTGGIEPGSVTFDLCRKVIREKVLVPEQDIRAAMKLLAQTDRWMVEGAAGVALAAMLRLAPRYQGRAVAVVLCGRNIMLNQFAEAIQ
jgi:threonine dehydratase